MHHVLVYGGGEHHGVFPKVSVLLTNLSEPNLGSATKRFCFALAKSDCRISPPAPKLRETTRRAHYAVSAPTVV